MSRSPAVFQPVDSAASFSASSTRAVLRASASARAASRAARASPAFSSATAASLSSRAARPSMSPTTCASASEARSRRMAASASGRRRPRRWSSRASIRSTSVTRSAKRRAKWARPSSGVPACQDPTTRSPVGGLDVHGAVRVDPSEGSSSRSCAHPRSPGAPSRRPAAPPYAQQLNTMGHRPRRDTRGGGRSLPWCVPMALSQVTQGPRRAASGSVRPNRDLHGVASVPNRPRSTARGRTGDVPATVSACPWSPPPSARIRRARARGGRRGAAAELDDLRAACDAAVARLLDAGAGTIVVLSAPAAATEPEYAAPVRGSLAPWGVDLDVPLDAGLPRPAPAAPAEPARSAPGCLRRRRTVRPACDCGAQRAPPTLAAGRVRGLGSLDRRR